MTHIRLIRKFQRDTENLGFRIPMTMT